MLKIKGFKYLLTLLVGFILVGCAGSREPIVPQANSGMEQTQEWLQYNENAKKNNQPILDFIATSMKKPPKNGKTLNYDNFNAEDKKIYIITKWHNLKKDNLLEIKVYQPDGRLSYYGKQNYKFNTNKWVTWNNIRVKHNYTAKNIGTWKADIYMNGKKAVSKKFNIGTAQEVQKVTTNKTIGVFPFYDSEMSKWKFGYGSSYYIANGILYHNKNISIIPNNLIRKDLLIPNTTYKDFDSYIQNDLNSNNSIIIELAKKHNMDYVVLGKIEATASRTLDTEFVTYVVSVKDKKIIAQEKVTDKITRSQAHIGVDWAKLNVNMYEKVLQSILPHI